MRAPVHALARACGSIARRAACDIAISLLRVTAALPDAFVEIAPAASKPPLSGEDGAATF
jgi:hypothetical protein